MRGDLSDKQLSALEYLTNPKFSEMSLSDIAVMVGVTRQTLHNWRQYPEFSKAENRQQKNYLLHSRRDVDSSLVKKAKDGNVHALRLYYEVTGIIRDVKEGYDRECELEPLNIVIDTSDIDGKDPHEKDAEA